MSSLDIATLNVWVGQRGPDLMDNLRMMLDDLDYPEVVGLQEAIGLHEAPKGYRRHALDRGHRDNHSCQLLVRDDLEMVRRHFVRPDGPTWYGPKHGLAHPPRVYAGAAVRYQRQVWDVLDVHRVPGGCHGDRAQNLDAYDAEHDALVRYAQRRANLNKPRPLVMLGDWNNGTHDNHDTGVRALADRIGARTYLIGVDGALVRGATASDVHLLNKPYGSDSHRPVAMTLTAQEPRD